MRIRASGQSLKEQWLALKAADAKLKPKDGADALGVSEAEILAVIADADATVRLDGDVQEIARRMIELGETISLTRNDSVVIERLSPFRRAALYGGGRGMLFKGTAELHVNFNHWRHAFATVVKAGEREMASLQFFDIDGSAVHKVYLRDKSNRAAYDDIVSAFRAADQNIELKTLPLPAPTPHRTPPGFNPAVFLAHWGALLYPSLFDTFLTRFAVSRIGALDCAKGHFARELDPAAFRGVFDRLAEIKIPFTASAGNWGCRQECHVTIDSANESGPFINAHEEAFHMHVRKDRLARLFAVTLPSRHGAVTQLELYGPDGSLSAFLSSPKESLDDDRDEWRALIADLPGR